jgi:hypothetical protein
MTDSDDGFFLMCPDGTFQVNRELINLVRIGPLDGFDDVLIGGRLLELTRSEFEKYGTDRTNVFDNDDARSALSSFKACCIRLGITEIDFPFRDFTTFRSWWLKNGASNSWQARRDLVENVFDPLVKRFDNLLLGIPERTLFDPLNINSQSTWPKIQEEIEQLRKHAASANSDADTRNLGNDCVVIIEKLSAFLYRHADHGDASLAEEPSTKTKNRLTAIVEHEFLSSSSHELVKVVRSTIELAQAIKHNHNPTLMDTMILAESTIFLVAVLDRLLNQRGSI